MIVYKFINKFKYNKYQRHNFIEPNKREVKPDNEINICGLNHTDGPDKWLPNKCNSLINDATNSGFGLNLQKQTINYAQKCTHTTK